LSSTEFVEPPPPNKIPGYATNSQHIERHRPFLNITCSFQADLAMEVAPILNIFLFTGMLLAISSNSE